MTTYRMTRQQLDQALTAAIEMFIELYDDRDPDATKVCAVDEIMGGIDAARELVANDPTERLRLQLPDNEDALRAENKKLRELEVTAWGWVALADGHNEERAWVYRSCARAVLRALGIDTDGDLTETAYQKLDEHEAHDGRLLNL